MGLISLACLLISAGLWVLCFFEPVLASRTFIAIFVIGLEGYCAVLLLNLRTESLASRLTTEFTSDELDLVSTYKCHFAYPGATRELSAAVAGVGLAAFAFVPLLFWKAQYVEGGIIAVNWFVAGPLSHKLSPLNGLKAGAERGNDTALRRLNAWDSAWEKIMALRRAARESRSP